MISKVQTETLSHKLKSLLLFLSTNVVTSSLFLTELNSPKGRIKQVINATNVLMLHVIVKFYQRHMFQ